MPALVNTSKFLDNEISKFISKTAFSGLYLSATFFEVKLQESYSEHSEWMYFILLCYSANTYCREGCGELQEHLLGIRTKKKTAAGLQTVTASL